MPVSDWTRRELIAGAGLLAVGPSVAAAVARASAAAAPPDGRVVGWPPLSDEQYLALADRIMGRLNHTWVRHRAEYSAGHLRVGVIYNAALLTVHATAAEAGHFGRARNDARARALVDRLTASPPFFEGRRGPRSGKMFHTPGWMADMNTFRSTQDKSIDPKVAEGLVAAWRARDTLALPPATVARIVDCVERVARGRFFRYPQVRLNQINWNAEMYSAAATLTGDPELLRRDYRDHLRRFVAGVRRPLVPHGTTNLGPSYRFHYLPHHPEAERPNLDSAEYANITLHALLAYDSALAAGMRPLPEADMAILRAWVERALFGYWMHSGMLNWDSGLGLARWMKSKTWAYAQQGLIAIAAATRFHRDPAHGPWAKHLFDRGLALYESMLVDGNTRAYPSAHLYGVTAMHQGVSDERVFSARMAANAVRAVSAGLGRMPAPEPPPFYAFDADIGRLAVSTPRYSTAIVSENRGAFPYGGVELARLFDASGRPVGGLGGRGPASFGIVVRSSRRRSFSQTPRAGAGALTLLRSPRGPIDAVRHLPRDPDAGPFDVIEAAATTTSDDATILTHHRFAADFIDTTWTIRRHAGHALLSVEAQFPSLGRDAGIHAIHHDGRTTTLQTAGPAVPLHDVSHFTLGDPDAGYTVTLFEIGAGAARARRVAPQATFPRPGPTLILRVPLPTADTPARIRARITPNRRT